MHYLQLLYWSIPYHHFHLSSRSSDFALIGRLLCVRRIPLICAASYSRDKVFVQWFAWFPVWSCKCVGQSISTRVVTSRHSLHKYRDMTNSLTIIYLGNLIMLDIETRTTIIHTHCRISDLGQGLCLRGLTISIFSRVCHLRWVCPPTSIFFVIPIQMSHSYVNLFTGFDVMNMGYRSSVTTIFSHESGWLTLLLDTWPMTD